MSENRFVGSTSLSAGTSGNVVSQQGYKAWGEVRSVAGNSPTNYTYTGQYSNTADFGLMFYNARWYDPYLNHFTQPDTIVPNPYNPQDWNRYAYARNNPVKYTDPSGHSVDCGLGDPYCDRGEYTPGGLMRLYGNKNREKLILEIDDYVRAHPDYDYKDDTYLGFSMGDNRDL